MMRLLISGAAIVACLAMLLAALAYALSFFLSYGLPPCADEGGLYRLSQGLLLSSLVGAAIWLAWVATRPSWRQLLLALALPLTALLAHNVLRRADAVNQRQCAARTVEQAAANYRITRSYSSRKT